VDLAGPKGHAPGGFAEDLELDHARAIRQRLPGGIGQAGLEWEEAGGGCLPVGLTSEQSEERSTAEPQPKRSVFSLASSSTGDVGRRAALALLRRK